MDFVKRWRRWFPAVVLMALIFMFSSFPAEEIPELPLDLLWKKGAHMLGYALLTWTYAYACGGADRPYTDGRLLLLTALYALSDEWHQSFVAGRHASLLDVGIDTLGGLLGLIWLRRLGWPWTIWKRRP